MGVSFAAFSSAFLLSFIGALVYWCFVQYRGTGGESKGDCCSLSLTAGGNPFPAAALVP